jgi:hypothetical protein
MKRDQSLARPGLQTRSALDQAAVAASSKESLADREKTRIWNPGSQEYESGRQESRKDQGGLARTNLLRSCFPSLILLVASIPDFDPCKSVFIRG